VKYNVDEIQYILLIESYKMNGPYAMGDKVHTSFGSNLGLRGKIVGYIVELEKSICDYFPGSHIEILTTHVQTVNTISSETVKGGIDGLVAQPRHIYFDEYIVGKEYQMADVAGNFTDLGVLVKKDCVGRPYDMDMKLTYQKDGIEKEHDVVFGPHYREKPATV
jgi:hypothetical protein